MSTYYPRPNELPDYEPDKSCPACGHAEVRTTYCERAYSSSKACWPVVGPHLDRTCQRCCYQWAERPLNVAAASPAASSAAKED
jgi:hypothetical protein